MQGIMTRGITQLLANLTVIQQTRGIKSIKQAIMKDDRTRADGLLPFLVYADCNGMMLPMNQISRCADTPLVTAKTSQGTVMPLVQKPIKIIRTFMSKGDAVAYEIRTAHRREVLHCVWLPFMVITRSSLLT